MKFLSSFQGLPSDFPSGFPRDSLRIPWGFPRMPSGFPGVSLEKSQGIPTGFPREFPRFLRELPRDSQGFPREFPRDSQGDSLGDFLGNSLGHLHVRIRAGHDNMHSTNGLLAWFCLSHTHSPPDPTEASVMSSIDPYESRFGPKTLRGR